MKKLLVGILFGAFTLGLALSNANAFNKAGFVFGDNGEKHWYVQTMEKKKYFHTIIEANTYTITFVEPNKFQSQFGSAASPTMTDTDANRMMINNVISGWYSHSDADFQTRPDELYAGSALQKRGLCIQSKTYPKICIVVEYIVDNGYITKVHHASCFGGCK